MVNVLGLINDVMDLNALTEGEKSLERFSTPEEIAKLTELNLEKLQRLRESLVIEADPATRFKLEKQIKETEVELRTYKSGR